MYVQQLHAAEISESRFYPAIYSFLRSLKLLKVGGVLQRYVKISENTRFSLSKIHVAQPLALLLSRRLKRNRLMQNLPQSQEKTYTFRVISQLRKRKEKVQHVCS